MGVDACTSTPAPEAVPSAAEAETAARDLLRRAGIDVAHLRITGTSNDWAAQATAAPVLDGTTTQGFDTSIAFGSHGAITSASGWLAEPVKADTYPLTGVATAISRLNDGRGVLDGYAPVPGLAADLGTTATGATEGAAGAEPSTAAPAPAVGPSSTTTSTTGSAPPTTWGCSIPLASGPASGNSSSSGGGPETTTTVVGDGDAGGSGSGTPRCPSSVCPAPPCPTGQACAESCPSAVCDPVACADPYPGPTVVPVPAETPPTVATTTVTVTSVELVLAAVDGTDGSIWLVPAYRLAGDDGSTSTVLAVDESFVAPATGSSDSSDSSGSPGSSGVLASVGTAVAPDCTAPWMC